MSPYIQEYNLQLPVIKDHEDAFEGFRGPLKKSNRGDHLAIWTPACKAQGNQHEIRIAFFEREYLRVQEWKRTRTNAVIQSTRAKVALSLGKMCEMGVHKESDVFLLPRMKVERKETEKS